jgi:hypothetical protein
LFNKYTQEYEKRKFANILAGCDINLESVDGDVCIFSLTVVDCLINGMENLHVAASMLIIDEFSGLVFCKKKKN